MTSQDDGRPTMDLNDQLLDRQVIDVDGLPVCKVDDLLLEQGSDGAWRVTAILVGPDPLGSRLGGRLGRTLSGIHRRMHGLDEPAPPSVAWQFVRHVDSAVHLSLRRSELPSDLAPLEDWLRVHVIDRIPGSGHASG